MKKFPVLSPILVLAVIVLGSCGSSESGNNTTIANPMTETSREEMARATGISLSAPADASDARYSVLDSDGKKVSQVDFIYKGKAYTYRAEFAGGLEAYDMTGLYYDWKEEKDEQVGNCAARLMLCDEAAGLYWIDIVPGINYSLGCGDAASEEEMLEVAGLVFESLQSSILEHAVQIKELAGVYNNGDPDEGCDQIVLADAGDGEYDVEITLLRLATMSGKGKDMGGVMNITLTDPSGNEMSALFYSDSGAYSICITESTWGYLEEGTEIKGFLPVE